MRKLITKISKYRNLIYLISGVIIFVASVILGAHNASLYDPSQGFDGAPHVYYVKYIYENRQIPPPDQYETHQPPLYYIISAMVLSVFQDIKSIQYVNVVVLWMIIGVAVLGLNKIFKNRNQVFLGMLSLAALPMLNIFPPTVTNELLNTFWIISAFVSCLYLASAKNDKEYTRYFLFLMLSLILGIWTKVTIISIIPAVIITIFISTKNLKKSSIYSAICLVVFALAYAPIYFRAATSGSPSNIVHTASKIIVQRSPDFYYRLDWIPKVDMYTTQYYSFLGGAWNSFWSDGHNVITPFVPFHKKAFILWSLGFLLLPISLYGLWQLFRNNKKVAYIMLLVDLTMIGFYVLYNMVSNHYSAVRLTYEMGIVLPYAFGIAAAGKNKKILPVLFELLAIQFIILVSFFWILPWWFVTQPKAL